MPNEPRGGREYEAQDAALAQAGPARSHSDEEAAARSDAVSAEQTDERLQRMLDAREERFARRRKPMGPTPHEIPETVPDEAPPVPGEQPSTTPESHEP